MLSDWVFAWPALARQGLAEDDRILFAVAEVPAAQQRNPHRLEKLRTDPVGIDHDALAGNVNAR